MTMRIALLFFLALLAAPAATAQECSSPVDGRYRLSVDVSKGEGALDGLRWLQHNCGQLFPQVRNFANLIPAVQKPAKGEFINPEDAHLQPEFWLAVDAKADPKLANLFFKEANVFFASRISTSSQAVVAKTSSPAPQSASPAAPKTSASATPATIPAPSDTFVISQPKTLAAPPAASDTVVSRQDNSKEMIITIDPKTVEPVEVGLPSHHMIVQHMSLKVGDTFTVELGKLDQQTGFDVVKVRQENGQMLVQILGEGFAGFQIEHTGYTVVYDLVVTRAPIPPLWIGVAVAVFTVLASGLVIVSIVFYFKLSEVRAAGRHENDKLTTQINALKQEQDRSRDPVPRRPPVASGGRGGPIIPIK